MAVENTGICSTEGCNKPLRARGLCDNCYKKAARRGALPERQRWINPVPVEHPLYQVWNRMKQRCNRPSHPDYKDYGGRGIYYNPAWEQFPAFYADMAEGYEEGLMLDRINNDAPYTKINCKWSTPAESARNRRSTKLDERSVILIRALYRAKRPGISQALFRSLIAPLFNIAPITLANITSDRQWNL